MEANEIIKMEEDAFQWCYSIIDATVIKNGGKMVAVLKHPSRCALGQVINPSNSNIDDEVPVPSLL